MKCKDFGFEARREIKGVRWLAVGVHAQGVKLVAAGAEVARLAGEREQQVMTAAHAAGGANV